MGVSRVYEATRRLANVASRVASRRVSLAAATYSHSSVVGRRFPRQAQYAFAANHDTCVTGRVSSDAVPAFKSPAQSRKYDGSAKRGLMALRRHAGRARTNARKSARVT